jgi:ABC-type dipeptide/oligopeptide/nickel transport system permease subunit
VTTQVSEAIPARTPLEGRNEWVLVWERLRRKRLAMIALVVIVVIYGAGLSASLLAPYSYTEQDLDRGLEGISADHWLGTDRLGRDLLSRAMFSARTTLIITAAVVLSGSLLLGNGLGLLAGYRGGWIDDAIMRVGEVFSSLPALVMLILINAALSSRVLEGVRWIEDNTFVTGLVSSGFASYITVFAALSLFFWVGTARIIRAQVLQLREREFIMAAESLGANQRRIILRHVLPSVTFLIVLQISATLGSIAGSEILLSWFGVGIQPPAPSFGAMIFEGSGARTFQAHPNLLLVPGIIVSLLLLSFSLLGDALNDAIASR